MEERVAPGGQVVSVRLSGDLVRRLDRLAEWTGRSRGYYLREAIEETLPVLETRYWAHGVQVRDRAERRAFGGLVAQLNDEPEAGEE